MTQKRNNEIVKRITTKYNKTVTLSIIFFTISLLLLFLLRGREYFIGGIIVASIYFFNLFSSKNIRSIDITNELITFKYYSFGFIERKVTYEIASLYTEVKQVVTFKGGVNSNMKFYTISNRTKIFELSLRELMNKGDFTFLHNLFSRLHSSS